MSFDRSEGSNRIAHSFQWNPLKCTPRVDISARSPHKPRARIYKYQMNHQVSPPLQSQTTTVASYISPSLPQEITLSHLYDHILYETHPTAPLNPSISAFAIWDIRTTIESPIYVFYAMGLSLSNSMPSCASASGVGSGSGVGLGVGSGSGSTGRSIIAFACLVDISSVNIVIGIKKVYEDTLEETVTMHHSFCFRGKVLLWVEVEISGFMLGFFF